MSTFALLPTVANVASIVDLFGGFGGKSDAQKNEERFPTATPPIMPTEGARWPWEQTDAQRNAGIERQKEFEKNNPGVLVRRPGESDEEFDKRIGGYNEANPNATIARIGGGSNFGDWIAQFGTRATFIALGFVVLLMGLFFILDNSKVDKVIRSADNNLNGGKLQSSLKTNGV